jgi:hypothetical protein
MVVVGPVVDRLSKFRSLGVWTPVGAFVWVDGVLMPVEDAPGGVFSVCGECARESDA